jgi:hypothetical protein
MGRLGVESVISQKTRKRVSRPPVSVYAGESSRPEAVLWRLLFLYYKRATIRELDPFQLFRASVYPIYLILEVDTKNR